MKNNISNTVVSGNDKTTTPKKNNNNISNIVTCDCSLCNMKFDSSFDVNEDSTNSMEVLYSPCYYQLSQSIMLLKKRTTTPITSNTKVTKNSKDAITYCMSLFEDYITMSSCKFTFLIIRCYCNFI